MGIEYCPKCEKILVKRKIGEQLFYTCSICGYQIEASSDEHYIKKKSKTELEKKKAENMLIIVDDALKARFTPTDTTLTCFRCKSHKIEFFQQQIHRADEPTTTFYRCTNCGNRWRQG